MTIFSFLVSINVYFFNHITSKGVTLFAGCSSLSYIVFIENMIDNMIREPHSESIRAEENEHFSILSSESVYFQDSVCDETSGSSNFLDLKPLRVSDSRSIMSFFSAAL